MYKIFTNEVGAVYSWDGAKGKQKFKSLKISAVIMDAVRLNKNTKEATEIDIINIIKKWLVRCKDRMEIVSRKRRYVLELIILFARHL